MTKLPGFLEEQASPEMDVVARWLEEIESAQDYFSDWKTRAEKVVKIYKGESGGKRGVDFNILWSNQQILQPSLYARTPKSRVQRRFKDKNPVARVASQILERACQFAIEENDFDEVMTDARDDYLLVGRGACWVRYVPDIHVSTTRKEVQVQEVEGTEPPEEQYFDAEGQQYTSEELIPEGGTFFAEKTEENLVYECVKVDYIPWSDFLHQPARQWTDVNWVAKRVYLTKNQATERFGDIARDLNYDHGPGEDKKEKSVSKVTRKAVIWEIWDKEERQVLWIAPSYKDRPIDVKDDPLRLRAFFPCPKPLLSPSATDSLIPHPDFLQYQDLANELSALTVRIEKLIKSLKVAGVYNAQISELARLYDEGVDLKLIPVQDWTTFAMQGGLSRSIDTLPIDKNAQVLLQLYQARQEVKQAIYEVTGISDIIRGATNPNETATAQQIKGQFATLRLSDRQKQMQEFAARTISIIGEIIAEHFSPDTLRLMTGVDFMQAETGFGFEDAVAMLRDDVLRSFNVTIETDSTINIDESLEKQEATEFVGAMSELLDRGMKAIQSMPGSAPLIGEIIGFAVRRYRAGREIEPALEDALEQLQAQMNQPPQEPGPPPGPSPDEMKIQGQMQMGQMKLELEGQKLQATMAKAFQELQANAADSQARLQVEREKLMADLQLAREKIHMDLQKKAMEIEGRYQAATIQAAGRRKQVIREKTKDPLRGEVELHREVQG